jgi:Suppressor of fused protein (SUFU)
VRFRRNRQEFSPGGSRIVRHADLRPPSGALSPQFLEERENLYVRFFGPVDSVYHELLIEDPHVDVYRFAPRPNLPFWTLVTGGMSDRRMHLPDDVPSELGRAELVLYVDEPQESYANLLRMLAHFPFEARTFFTDGHTFALADGDEPLFPGSELTTILFMGPIVAPDFRLREELVLEGDPVNLLWVVPITTAEADLKLERGMDALIELFDRNKHPVVLDTGRGSYV